ncbi:MAG: hypothetical protein IPQ09_18700 [Myxococcales bacterium]|nr:hypothetical protein [Myxococcales bacterium]
MVASVCAEAILSAGVQSDSLDEDTERLLLETLRTADGELAYEQQSSRNDVLERTAVDERLSSPVGQKRVLAIRMLPLLRNEDVFVAERIRAFLRAPHTGHDEMVAVLSVIQKSRTIHRLLKIADVDYIRTLLLAATRDVRIAACRVLATIGTGSPSPGAVIDELLEYVASHPIGEEFAVGVWALGRLAPRETQVARCLTDAVAKSLETERSATKDRIAELRAKDRIAALRACQALDGVASRELVEKLRSSVRSYKWDAETRQEALLTSAHVEPMTPGLLRFINVFIEQPVPALGNAPARALMIGVERCKRRVEDVRRVFGALQRSEALLVEHYTAFRSAVVAEMGESAVPAIREALEEIRALLVAYREFAERSSLNASSPLVS